MSGIVGEYIAMTIEDAIQILKKNENALDNSFMFFLHEHSVFDSVLFWDLYNALMIVGHSTQQLVKEESQKSAFWIYRSILFNIIYHFDPIDGAKKIKHFPDSNLALYLEVIEWVFNPIIQGAKANDWRQQFELLNPKFSVLEKHFG